MMARHKLLVGLGALLALGIGLRPTAPLAGDLSDASPWVQGLGARMRLVRGAALAQKDDYAAGVEISLDDGFKTYWRQPGDAGVPPSFDWSGSTNLASVVPDWPVPQRYDEAGVSVIGYAGDGVVLPLHVTATDPSAPVNLKLTLSFAACKTICVPERAEATLTLPPEGPDGLYAETIEAAAREIPKRVEPGSLGLKGGDGKSLSLGAQQKTADAPMSALSLRPKLEADEHVVDVFVEGPAGWLFGAPKADSDPMPSNPGGELLLPIIDRPKEVDRNAAIPFTLTILTDRRALETTIAVRPLG